MVTPWERAERVFNLVTKSRSRDATLSLQKERRLQRNPLDVSADILRAAMDGPLKTRIMYKANLNHVQLASYLNHLVERGLIAVVTDSIDGRARYRTTEKGIQFLRDYARLKRSLDKETLAP